MHEIIGKHVVQLMLIAGRNHYDALLSAMPEKGARVINTIYGKGSVKASYLMDAFGLVPEENKVVISCLIPSDKLDAMFAMLDEQFHFNKPNTGIAFTIPVEKLSY